MVRLFRTDIFVVVVYLIFSQSFNILSYAQDNDLEKNISKALSKEVHSKNITVKVSTDSKDTKKIVNLIIKFDEIKLGEIRADFLTIQLKQPIIDNKLLQNWNKFKLISAKEKKVNILLSINSLQNYLLVRAKEFGKKNVNINLKFSPPYIECFYDVPKDEISSESIGLLSKFIPGDKLEGYAAFTFTIKNNELSAHSSKVILNHFLLPAPLLKIFENRFNPFENIPTLELMQYHINKINVQSKYLLLSN